MTDYISVHNWKKFQHYNPKIRNPPWIKFYTELLSDDDYLSLSEHRALLLHRLHLAYASSRSRLHADTASLSRRLGLRVTRADLEALNHAGYIDIVASITLAEGYHDASTYLEVEVEKERLKEGKTKGNSAASSAKAFITNGGYHYTDSDLRDELAERGLDLEALNDMLDLAHTLRNGDQDQDIELE